MYSLLLLLLLQRLQRHVATKRCVKPGLVRIVKKKLHGIVLRSGQFWRARSQLQEKYVVSSSTLLQQTIWFGLTPILISWILILIVCLLPNVTGTSHIILIFILTPLRWFCRPPFSYVFVIAISSSELWSSNFFIIFSCVSSYESLN